MGQVTVHCERCGHRFDVAGELAGSIQNCPSCGRATEVDGSFDPVWDAARVVAAFAALIAVGLAWSAFGPLAAVGVLGASAAIALVVRLAL